MAAVTICNDFGAQKIKSVTVSTVSPSIYHEVMGLNAMICALQKSTSQSHVSSGSSIAGLMVTSSKRTCAIPTPRAPVPAADHCWPIPPQETLKHSSLCLCGVPGSWCAQGLFATCSQAWANWSNKKCAFLYCLWLKIADTVTLRGAWEG